MGEPPDILDRTFRFAVRVTKLVRALPKSVDGYVLAKQVMRSGTGIGANVEEAQGAHSKKDFARRMNIARAEARETLYWLRLIKEAELISAARLEELVNEADELVRILTTIVKKSKEQNEKQA